MDVAFHLVCHLGGLYEIVRTVGVGDAADRHSDAKAVSRVTVVRTKSYHDANRLVELLRAADLDHPPVE